MLYNYSHTESESLAEICATVADIRIFFQGNDFYWCTLYIHNKAFGMFGGYSQHCIVSCVG